MIVLLFIRALCFFALVPSFTPAGQVSASELYPSDKNVILLETIKDLESRVLPSDGIWMLQFFKWDETNSRKFAPSYLILANVTAGVFHLAAADISTEEGAKIASHYNVQPHGATPKVLILGGDKTKPPFIMKESDVMAGNPTNLLEALMKTTVEVFNQRMTLIDPSGSRGGGSAGKTKKGGSGDGDVLELTADNFEELVLNNPAVVGVAFTAPWCGYCKQLQPEWEEAAAQLAGSGAVLGWLDATAHTELAAIYGVKGYPTIKVFPGGSPKSHADGQDFRSADRSAKGIAAVMLDEVDRSGTPREIVEMTSQQVLEDHCAGANHICILAALPHISDSGAERRNKYRDLIATVAKSFRTANFDFLWFEGSSQPDLEKAFGLSFGYPAVVAFSMDRKAFAVLHGSFSEKSMTHFAHAITTGRQATEKLATGILPNIATVEPWDGQDAPVVEEEFSLEDIMGDEF